MKKTSVYLGDEHLEKLRWAAEVARLSQADVIREAILDYRPTEHGQSGETNVRSGEPRATAATAPRDVPRFALYGIVDDPEVARSDYQDEDFYGEVAEGREA